MKHQWLDGELEEFWWLTESEEQFIHERSHDNRLVYVVMLKYFQIERQFLKECEWRFNGGNHQQLLKQLKYWYQQILL